jgi:hypothetical protein
MPDRQEITNRYLALVAAGTSCSEETNATARLECHPSRFLQRTFESFTGVQAGIGHDSYEASTAPGFWIRRYADSTEDEFLELLMLVLTSLDQPFLERTKGS